MKYLLVCVLLCLAPVICYADEQARAGLALDHAYSSRSLYLPMEDDFFAKETDGMSRLQACHDFIQSMPFGEWRDDAQSAYDAATTKYNYFIILGYGIVMDHGIKGEDFLTTAEYYYGAEFWVASEDVANQAKYQFDVGWNELILLNSAHWLPDGGVDHLIARCEGLCVH